MVQVIENRTDLDGMILERRSHPTLETYDVLVVDVRRATPVPGYADLLSQHAGGQIEMSVKRDLLPTSNIDGWTIHSRARMAGPGVIMAESDPGPGDFSVGPAPQ